MTGVIGSPAGRLTEGDALGRVAPSLSLFDGVGAGTLVMAEGEFRRLRDMTPAERLQAVSETVGEIEAEPPAVSARAAWISTTAVIVVVVATLVSLIRNSVVA